MRDGQGVGVLQHHVRVGFLISAVTLVGLGERKAWALDSAAVGGDITRTAFGPGTGVIVGIVDSGVDTTHEALAGNDSTGKPRLVAEANFVTTEPTNVGQDVLGHGTAVLGVIGSADPTQLGMAPDVRYVDARVLASNGSFASDSQVINGIGFAVTNGANIINMSLNYSTSGGYASTNLSLISDYLSDTLGIAVVVSAGNTGGSGTSHTTPAPADAYNIFSVASSSRATNFKTIAGYSSYGVNADGLVRPNITAIGDSVYTPFVGGVWHTWSGTSFAAPQVSGMLASQIEYGKANGLSVDPRVLRATMLNSATKINDRNNQAWAPTAASTVNGVYTVTKALDDNSGSGQINGASLVTQYEAGQHSAGSVPDTGWDLATIAGQTGTADYLLSQSPTVGSTLSVTLTWDRHVGWRDLDNNGIIDNLDSFTQSSPLSNFDLSLYLNGVLLATSDGTLDNIEQLNWKVTTPGDYEVEVSRLNVAGAVTNETYSVAWAAAVPEPGSLVLLIGGAAIVGVRRRRACQQ